MGRIRTIKPEFPQSESMGRISREARLCFILLWTLVDDGGRTRASSRLLASLLYPYDEDAGKKIPVWLNELQAEKCIVLYQVEGDSYLEVLNFNVHQKIDHARDSKLPAFDESSRTLANSREKERGIKECIKEGSVSRKVANAPEIELPEWLPRDLWNQFVDTRKAIKKPFPTAHSQELAIKTLTGHRESGYDTTKLIEKSIEQGWMSFVIKEDSPKRKIVEKELDEEEALAFWQKTVGVTQ